jgi:hypothetical protein
LVNAADGLSYESSSTQIENHQQFYENAFHIFRAVAPKLGHRLRNGKYEDRCREYGQLRSAQKEKSVRAPLRSTLNKSRRATSDASSILECHSRVRACLTLTFAPGGARSGRFTDSRMPSPRPFRYKRARV